MKWYLPLITYLLGWVMFLLETVYFNLFEEVEIVTRLYVNNANKVITIAIPIILFIKYVPFTFLEMKTKMKYVYVLYNVSALSYVAYYWIINLMWR